MLYVRYAIRFNKSVLVDHTKKLVFCKYLNPYNKSQNVDKEVNYDLCSLKKTQSFNLICSCSQPKIPSHIDKKN